MNGVLMLEFKIFKGNYYLIGGQIQNFGVL